MTTPDNLNFLYDDKFQLAIQKLPTVSFFCSEANIPGAKIPTQTLKNYVANIPVRSGPMEFEELMVSFKIDEDLTNWKELYHWLTGLGHPKSLEQFKELNEEMQLVKSPGYSYTSDATLMIMSNTMNANVNITFFDLFPIGLDSINFVRQQQGDVLVGKATFVYSRYEFS
jgi:hypothetical protein